MQILWEDTAALVVNKPAGLLSQAAEGIDSVEVRLREMLRVRDAHPGTPYVGLPHRIDRPVSGALLVARHHRATQRFGAQFQSRKIDKRYLAAVEGVPSQREATWIDSMRKIPGRPLAELVAEDHPAARRAVLHYRLLASSGGISVLEIALETGRMHQIRLQCAARGHAIVGDWLYDSRLPFGPPVEELDDPRRRSIALHARQITFRHPKSGKAITVTAPLPPAWNSLPVPENRQEARSEDSTRE